MPKYNRPSEGQWSVTTTMLGWGLLGLALVVVVFFLAGLYVGYSRGFQDGRAQSDGPSPPSPVTRTSPSVDDTAPAAPSGSGDTAPGEDPGVAFITERDVGKRGSTADTPAIADVEGPEPAASQPEGPPPDTQGPVEVPSEPFFTVQIASSQKRANARRMRDRLRGEGHPASISEATVEGRRFYRVRVGNFPTRTAAANYAERMVNRGDIDDYWISLVRP